MNFNKRHKTQDSRLKTRRQDGKKGSRLSESLWSWVFGLESGRGFTLIETFLVAMLFGVVLLAISSAFVAGKEATGTNG